MKKAGRTPSKLRLKEAFSRSQSNGNIFFPGKLPEERKTPVPNQLFSRTSSVPLLVTESSSDFSHLDSIPRADSRVIPKRGLSKTPVKARIGLVKRSSTPMLLRKKVTKVESQLPILTDSEAHRSLGKGFSATGTVKSKANLSFTESKKVINRRKLGLQSLETTSLESCLPDTVTRVLFQTRTGVIGGKPKPHNQDSYLYIPHFNRTTNQRLVGVFDGHGERHIGVRGHEVSAFVKTYLPTYIDKMLPKTLKMNVDVPVPKVVIQTLRSAMTSAFLALNQDLVRKTSIDTSFSGSTAVSVLIRGTSLLCSNIGDSRAVLGKKSALGWRAIPLSVDHKPDLPKERVRIIACGGRVEPFVGNS